MKKKFLLLFVIFFTCILRAQELKTRLFPHSAKNFYLNTIIGAVGENYFAVQLFPSSNSASNEITLYRLDSTFNKTGEAKFAGLILKDGMYNFYSYSFLNEKLYFFYQMQKKGVRQLAAAEVDLQTLKLKGTYENIAECTKTYDPIHIGGYFEGEFSITKSENGKYFAVSCIENRKIKFVLCNDSLKKMWETKYNTISPVPIKDIKVNNDGRVFFLHTWSSINPTAGYHATSPEQWMLVEINGDSVNGNPLPNKGYEIFGAAIGFTPSGNVFIVGYYSFFTDGYFEIRNIGTFYFSPFLNNGKLIFHPFTREFLCEGKSENEKKEVDKNLKKYKVAGDEGIFSIKLIVGCNGRVYLIGEEVWSKSLPIDVISSLEFTEETGQLTLVPNEDGNIEYGDLIVTQFDTIGNLAQNTWVEKKQAGNSYASYEAISCNDGLYILFNENYNNIINKPADESEIEKLRTISKTIPIMIAISESGITRRTIPFGNENYMSIVTKSAYANKNEIIFYARKQGDYCFGIIDHSN